MKPPSRKWWAATASAAGGLGILAITHGFHAPEQIALVTFATQRAVAYFTPNAEDN